MANTGEWAEFYAFIKLVEDRKISAADSNLNAIPDNYYHIHKIHRLEDDISKIFDLASADTVNIEFHREEDLTNKFSILKAEFNGAGEEILSAIKSNRGSFEIELGRTLMKRFGLDKLKSPSARKGDIELEINDKVTNQPHRAEFSLKSYLGQKPTLLNPGKPTRFQFELLGFDGDREAINSDNLPKIGKLQRRFLAAKEASSSVEFVGVRPNARGEKTFERNLQLFDFEMPNILAGLISLFFQGKGANIKELTRSYYNEISLSNPSHKLDAEMLEIKITHFLMSVALGMVPDTKWEGNISTDGGYIVVKSNGDLVCFHVYNYYELGKYLFENTKFDSASSNRYDYANVYEENGKIYFDLILQIKFS